MENHSILLSDDILEVDGVIYCELRSIERLVLFQDGSEGGKEEQVLVHTRSIGDKRYTVKRMVSEGSENEETEEECNMTCLEVAAFQEEWNKNWNPSLGQEYTGGNKGSSSTDQDDPLGLHVEERDSGSDSEEQLQMMFPEFSGNIGSKKEPRSGRYYE